MIDANKPDLDQLARRLTAVAAELAEVNERLDDVQSDMHPDEMHRSTISLANKKKESKEREHKMYDPLAGP